VLHRIAPLEALAALLRDQDRAEDAVEVEEERAALAGAASASAVDEPTRA
jgi:hypothetical protein